MKKLISESIRKIRILLKGEEKEIPRINISWSRFSLKPNTVVLSSDIDGLDITKSKAKELFKKMFEEEIEDYLGHLRAKLIIYDISSIERNIDIEKELKNLIEDIENKNFSLFEFIINT